MLYGIIISLPFFLVTTAASYVIWYLSSKTEANQENATPDTERKPEAKVKKKKATCELNKIMGYDFIQIQTPGEERTSEERVEDSRTEERPTHRTLFATGAGDGQTPDGDTEGNGEDHRHENGGVTERMEIVLEATESDINEMFDNSDWPTGGAEAYNDVADKLMNGAYDDSDMDAPDDSSTHDEGEAMIEQYRNSLFDDYSVMGMVAMTEEDREALEKVMGLTGKKEDND